MKTGNASVDGQFTGLSPILFFLFVYQDGHGLRFDSKIFANGLSDVLHKRSFLFDRSPFVRFNDYDRHFYPPEWID